MISLALEKISCPERVKASETLKGTVHAKDQSEWIYGWRGQFYLVLNQADVSINPTNSYCQFV